MYDSRSDHPRKGLHMGRYDRDMRTGQTDGIDGGIGRRRLLSRMTSAKQAIAEGLAEHLDDARIKRAVYERDNRYSIKRNSRPKEAINMSIDYPIKPSQGALPVPTALAARKKRATKQQFSRLSDGIKHPVKVTTVAERERNARLNEAADTLTVVLLAAIDKNEPAKRLREYGVTEPLPEGSWREVHMSKCAFGCKVYENQDTRERVVAHNSTYGCYIAGTPTNVPA